MEKPGPTDADVAGPAETRAVSGLLRFPVYSPFARWSASMGWALFWCFVAIVIMNLWCWLRVGCTRVFAKVSHTVFGRICGRSSLNGLRALEVCVEEGYWVCWVHNFACCV